MADTRADRTRASMREALMEMLKEMPFEDVTVRALSERAGVSRNTFYNHYQDLYALVEDCYICELRYYHRNYRPLADYEHREEACEKLLEEYAHRLTFFAENPNFARVYFEGFCTSPYFEECRSLMEAPLLDHIATEYGMPNLPYLTQEECVHYARWGAFGLFRTWFFETPRQPVEPTAKRIVYCMLHSLAGAAGRPIAPKYLQAINAWKLNSGR